jgi:hypothetical protein
MKDPFSPCDFLKNIPPKRPTRFINLITHQTHQSKPHLRKVPDLLASAV